MITAVIILAAVAVLLGAYIGFDVVRSRRALPAPINEKSEKSEKPVTFDAPAPQKAEATERKQTEEAVPQKVDDTAEQKTVELAPQKAEAKPKSRRIVVKYSRSFTAKLIQSDEERKKYYSELKNALLALDGVKSRISWKCESFRKGRATVAKLKLRGKSLYLYLALDPKELDGKYRVKDAGEVKSLKTTPCMYKVNSDRRLKYARELIQQTGIAKTARKSVDHALLYPYEEDEPLIQRRLIKVVREDERNGAAFVRAEPRTAVKASEVDKIMTDEVAASLIERSEIKADKSRQAIINIDTLAQFFKDGETVTLDLIKERVARFNKNTTYIKVLARGTLDKTLTVEADSFSLQAVKMILLTGGKAIKKK